MAKSKTAKKSRKPRIVKEESGNVEINVEEQGQGNLFPDMDHPAAKEIISLSKKYKKAMQSRMSYLKEEVALKEKIHAIMKENDMVEFKSSDVEVEIKTTEETVKVKIKKEEEE